MRNHKPKMLCLDAQGIDSKESVRKSNHYLFVRTLHQSVLEAETGNLESFNGYQVIERKSISVKESIHWLRERFINLSLLSHHKRQLIENCLKQKPKQFMRKFRKNQLNGKGGEA